MDTYTVRPTGPLRGSVRPPGSKSLTNRALVCAALAAGESTLTGVLDSVDTRVMVDSLQRLGITVAADWAARRLTIAGCRGQIPRATADLYVANSGTTARFLAATVALGVGTYRLDGNARMRERPIRDLLDALTQLGVEAVSADGSGCPPITIRSPGLPGGAAEVRGDVSSQFLSGLLLAAPSARAPVTLRVQGRLVSVPYVEMTLAVMESFGVRVQADLSEGLFSVPQALYQGSAYPIEPDASAASYFLAAAAVSGGRVTVEELSRGSLQGDVAFVDLLERMGCMAEWSSHSVTVQGGPLQGLEVDMNAVSDTVMTMAVVALFAQGPTTITNVGHIRHKETDRIQALCVELRKLGAQVTERPEGLQITPPSSPAALHGAEIDTYDDHRMAMSLALAGLRVPGVVIRDPGCTSKTYPEYFQDLESLARNP